MKCSSKIQLKQIKRKPPKACLVKDWTKNKIKRYKSGILNKKGGLKPPEFQIINFNLLFQLMHLLQFDRFHQVKRHDKNQDH